MFHQYSDKSIVHLGFNYEPQPGFVRKLSEAFEAVQAKYNYKTWAIAPDKYFIKDIERRFLISFEFNRLGFMGLGLDVLNKSQAELADLFRLSFETMGVATIKRLGLKVMAFVPVEMNQREISNLIFGSFLQDAKVFEPLCGKPDDVLFQVHGRQKGLKTQTIISAMTAEQAGTQIMGMPNLEMIVEHKLFDGGLIQFRDRSSKDCFFVDNDLSDEDKPPASIPDFVKQALQASDYMIETAIYRLKSMNKKGAGNGSAK